MPVREPKEGDHPQAEEVYEYVDMPKHAEEAEESEAGENKSDEEK